MIKIDWTWHRFAELSNDQLYCVLKFRIEVFVVEQDCPYQECDDLDQNAWHLLGIDIDGQLQAYLRVLPPGDKYTQPAVGRILTSTAQRGRGLGDALMFQGTRFVDQQFPALGSRMSAQFHLQKFYRKHGYRAVGKQYLEDNIPHIEMFRPAPQLAQTPSLARIPTPRNKRKTRLF